MNVSISPNLTHIDLEVRGTEFLDEASDNGDRRTLRGISNTQNDQEFDAAEQPFVRITKNAFGYGVSAPRGVTHGER